MDVSKGPHYEITQDKVAFIIIHQLKKCWRGITQVFHEVKSVVTETKGPAIICCWCSVANQIQMHGTLPSIVQEQKVE